MSEKKAAERKAGARARKSGAEAKGLAARALQKSSAPPAAVQRLVSLRLPDPHSLLGAHATPAGVVVRAFRPDAERVELLVKGVRKPFEMSRTHAAGLFEILFEGQTELFGYQLRAHYPGGHSYTHLDPYVFLPTVGTIDEHLFGEGRHEQIYEKLGSHVRAYGKVQGTSFAVWAPGAEGVSVVGDFNHWDGRLHQMRRLGASGVWEIFIPGVGAGAAYKYELRTRGALPFLKADPYAQYSEVPPGTSSIVFESKYKFKDAGWLKSRDASGHWLKPLSIYEVHLGSWRRVAEDDNRPLTYRETAPALADYCVEMGFTHVEFLPLKGHPYGGSWGYQVTSYFAPTARYGDPDDFRYLVDYLHERGIGVIMDWVPAHFPKDAWALGRFDGSALYEHLDPRLGEHPDWGTFIFNYGRKEVKNFLLASALFWIDECHVDGLRVDAVASMIYLDYSRDAGRWVPNRFGGRENLEAIDFIRELNDTVHRHHPGVLMIAEESTSWPMVTRPTSAGGLGFDYKWNMGWMHDTIEYFKKDPLHRRYFHNNLTFGIVYAWSENFILSFSHDEVVHMKGSMLNKMSGGPALKFANLRALYGYMWAHPGKKLLFMGGELAQWREWNDNGSLDWHLLEEPAHEGVRRLVAELNRLAHSHTPLHEGDAMPDGFLWLDVDNALENVLAFARVAPTDGRMVVSVCNLSPVHRPGYRLPLPRPGSYALMLNTDAEAFGGAGVAVADSFDAAAEPYKGLPCSAAIDLPPLSTMWFEAPPPVKADEAEKTDDGEKADEGESPAG
jgi:1,4-alpha-glucan branching enzyme